MLNRKLDRQIVLILVQSTILLGVHSCNSSNDQDIKLPEKKAMEFNKYDILYYLKSDTTFHYNSSEITQWATDSTGKKWVPIRTIETSFEVDFDFSTQQIILNLEDTVTFMIDQVKEVEFFDDGWTIPIICHSSEGDMVHLIIDGYNKSYMNFVGIYPDMNFKFSFRIH